MTTPADTEKLAETMKQLAPDVPFPWQFGDAHYPDCIMDADGAPIAQFFGPNKDRLQAMQTVIVAVNTLAGYKAEIVPANLAHESRAQPAITHADEEAGVAQWKEWLDEGRRAYFKQESAPYHLPRANEGTNFCIAYALRKLRAQAQPASMADDLDMVARRVASTLEMPGFCKQSTKNPNAGFVDWRDWCALLGEVMALRRALAAAPQPAKESE